MLPILGNERAIRDAGEITARTWADYMATAQRIAEKFGRNRLVADLRSEDFESLRVSISKTWGPFALGNEIQRVRIIFKCAHDAGLIDLPVRYGPQFKRPSNKVMRLGKAKKGAKLLEAADLQRLLKSAEVYLQAMIYLGLNCGFGIATVAPCPSTRWTLMADGSITTDRKLAATTGEWRGIHPIEAVVEAPDIRADGSVLQDAGYDAKTGLLLCPKVEFPPVQESPTRDPAIRARDQCSKSSPNFHLYLSHTRRHAWQPRSRQRRDKL